MYNIAPESTLTLKEYEKAMQRGKGCKSKNKVKTTTSNNEYKGGYRRTNVHKEKRCNTIKEF